MQSAGENAKQNSGIFELESAVRSYCRNFNVTFAAGSGSTVTDVNGRTYTDFLSGCSALNYGHNDPDMIAALMEYLSSAQMVHGLDLQTEAKQRFMETFQNLILAPRSLSYKFQFTGPTGTNAVEAALKLARKVTRRSNVIAFTNGFHGVSLGALAATGNSGNRMGGAVNLPDITRAHFDGYFGPDIDTAQMLEKVLKDPSSGFDKPAAILLETVQGEGGLNVATGQWMQHIARIAKENGALLIIDEIQAGCGRTGTFFSFEPLGIEPDIITLSKSLSGFGLPMSLVLIRPQFDIWHPGEHNGTFRGNNLAFVTATVALEKFWADDTFAGDVKRRGQIIEKALNEMTALSDGFRVKGRGMFRGLDVRDGEFATKVLQQCFSNGLIIEAAGPHDQVIKVLAPLSTPDAILLDGLRILREAIKHCLMNKG
jgi:diaminobutyrate-2-oxoglutarate transaminase